jgi:hypothetical protein
MARTFGVGIVGLGLLVALGPGCGGDRPRSRPQSPATDPGAPRPGVARFPLEADFRAAAGQTIYVPVYSHVYTSNDARPFDLAVTLSVRNTDRGRPIVVTSVRYHDRDGRPVRDYLKVPVRIAPLASMDFFVEERDTTGGFSASFLVEWVAAERVTAPVVEAVMIGTASTQGISFTCPGRVVAEQTTSP